MKADFSNDEEVTAMEIHTEAAVGIDFISGPDLMTISISGKQKRIQDLCIFVQPVLLPNLQFVRIHDAEVKSFQFHQFRGCFESELLPDAQLTIQIENSTIEMARGVQTNDIVFHAVPLVKKLILSRVEFIGTASAQIGFEEPAKVNANQLAFSNGSCDCHFEATLEQVLCERNENQCRKIPEGLRVPFLPDSTSRPDYGTATTDRGHQMTSMNAFDFLLVIAISILL